VRVEIILDLALVRFEAPNEMRLRGVERKHEAVQLVLRVVGGTQWKGSYEVTH
jgi:hypothetical protein